MPEKQKEQLISQSAVLSMGFTKSMIGQAAAAARPKTESALCVLRAHEAVARG